MDGIKGARVFTLALLIVLLVIGLLGMFLWLTTYETLMDPQFLKHIMEEEDAYDLIRQSMFRIINKSLPNGRDSMPYLEVSITEPWLKEELGNLVSDFYSFAKGKRTSPPKIPIWKLKNKVIRDMDKSRPLKERTRLVQFWFAPLPDEVRLEDFLSIDEIWGIRKFARGLDIFLLIMAGLCILAMASIRLVVKDWASSFLWFGSGFIASGSLLLLLIFLIKLLPGRMTLIQNLLYKLLHMDVPEASAYNLLWSFVDGLILPMKRIAMISIIVGAAIIYITPIKDNFPILIK